MKVKMCGLHNIWVSTHRFSQTNRFVIVVANKVQWSLPVLRPFCPHKAAGIFSKLSFSTAVHNLHHIFLIFSKLSPLNAYHLVRIREGFEWKTAPNTPLGHLEYLVMPFGLTNSPVILQALVNKVLWDFLQRFVCLPGWLSHLFPIQGWTHLPRSSRATAAPEKKTFMLRQKIVSSMFHPSQSSTWFGPGL